MKVLEQLHDIWFYGGKAIVHEDKELMDENVFDDNEGKGQAMINIILSFKSENLEELYQLCVDETEIQDSTQITHDVKSSQFNELNIDVGVDNSEENDDVLCGNSQNEGIT